MLTTVALTEEISIAESDAGSGVVTLTIAGDMPGEYELSIQDIFDALEIIEKANDLEKRRSE